MPTKRKREKKNKKECQLMIRIDCQVRDEFLTLCDDLDTSGAREIRKFIRGFLKKHDSGKS